jgi:serine/threonine protein kinase
MAQEREGTPRPADPQEALRERLAKDLAEGKTIVVTDADLQAPEVRAVLPGMLEELSAGHRVAGANVVPGYTLLGEIGRGGHSTVHLARQDTLGRKVALKVAPTLLAGDDRTRARLLQEARAMARLAHPNIVKIHDVVASDGAVAIAMEYVDGRSLGNLLRALAGPPRPDDMVVLTAALGSTPQAARALGDSFVRFCVRTLSAIARAVQHVHAAKLLHLDVKPSNILIQRDGTPLLADFGIVRDVEAQQTRTVAYTPVYAAPEQLRGAPDLAPPTDVYALGVTLYEALARQKPFDDRDLAKLIVATERGDFRRLSSHLEIAPDLENIVHKAMHPEPRLRYATAAALADDLDAFLDHRPVAARPLGRGERLRRWIKNEPWKAALAGALLLLVPSLGAVGGYLARQMPRIAAAEREENRRQASALRQRAYLEYLTQNYDVGFASTELQKAMALDPTPVSLACLLSMAHEEGDASLPALLAAHTTAIAANRGLQLLAAKAARKSAFFDSDEVHELLRSSDPTDKYVLALDRAFHAQDASHELAAAAALEPIANAAICHDGDALLLGLQAWFVANSHGGGPKFEALAAAAVARWGNDADVMAWFALAIAAHDTDAAIRRPEERIRARPDDARAHELVIKILSCDRTPAAIGRTASALQRADACGVDTPILRLHAELHRCRNGDEKVAHEVLATLPQEFATTHRRLEVLRRCEPPAGQLFRDSLLHGDRPSWWSLTALHEDAVRRSDRERAKELWQLARRHYPERRGLDVAATENLVRFQNRENAALAADAAQKLRLPTRGLNNAPTVAWLHLKYHRYRELADFAGHWQQLLPESARNEPAFYLGIAAARSGDDSTAAREFARTLATPSDGDWYGKALLEDAWLRVDPDGSPLLRDPGYANARLVAFDRWNEPRSQKVNGAWSNVIRAEVHFQNGDQAAAIAAAKAALRPGSNIETHAPAEITDVLHAVARRYGR